MRLGVKKNYCIFLILIFYFNKYFGVLLHLLKSTVKKLKINPRIELSISE